MAKMSGLDISLFIRLLCHRGPIRRCHEFTHCIHENGTVCNSEPLGLIRPGFDRLLWLSRNAPALALLLAAIGLYAVLFQMVLRRTKEIGIRMAVGAQQSAVLWQIMRQALGLVMAGICLAVPIALAAGRLIANQLYGLPPHDPMTFAVAVAVLLGVSSVAAYPPARRAARVDPMIALREE